MLSREKYTKLLKKINNFKMAARQMFERGKKAFASGKTLDLEFRLKQLKSLRQMYDECEVEFEEALKADLQKTRLESILWEKELLRADVSNIIRNFKKFTKTQRLAFNCLAYTDKALIMRQAYGLVYIAGAWNYPFHLTLMPLHGAIAGGNCAILKPSESAPNSAATMARLLPKYLDNECYQVFNGDFAASADLVVNNKFDYIFGTGSPTVGMKLGKLAAQNMVPCTLELGGKSPVFIHENCNLEMAAKRIMWGKCMNLGQTCVAPDYILCTKAVEEEFLKIAHKVLEKWFGENPQKSPHVPRIINETHFLRLKSIIERTKGTIVVGGETDQVDLWVAPTLISGVGPDDSTMEGEIFGPILPIMTCESHKDAIKFINERPKPLALYVFSRDKEIQNDFLEKTSSGGVTLNDTMWQNGWEGLPFGGVGESGIGSYHGGTSVETFSHKKSVLVRGYSKAAEFLGSARYPPYNENKIRFFRWFLRAFHNYNFTGQLMRYILAGTVGGGISYWYFI